MFGKFFASTFTGSMMGAGAEVFAVWGYVIANTHFGQVELNPKLLAVLLGSPEAAVEKAIEYLCSPDPNSRSSEAGGARLIREGNFAYHVVNHERYRKILNAEDRREYNRIKKQESRDRQQKSKRQSTKSAQPEPEPEPDKDSLLPSLRSGRSVDSVPEPTALPPTRIDRKKAELEWRIEACWSAYVAERQAFYREENGQTPPTVTCTPDIREAIRKAIERHDGSWLTPESREEWIKRSSARAAGIGLFLSPWHTARDADNDYASGQGKRYLEPWRPWKNQRGKPDPVPTFAGLYFDSKEAPL